jgi:hypothetical protein
MTPVKYYFYLELFPAVHYLLYLVKTRYKGCSEFGIIWMGSIKTGFRFKYDKIALNCFGEVFELQITLNISLFMEKHFKFTNAVIALPLFFVVFCGLFWLEIDLILTLLKTEFCQEHFRFARSLLVRLFMLIWSIFIIQFLYLFY